MSVWLRARCVSERHSTAIDGSPIEQRGYKKVHWEKRDSAGETKRIGATMVESSVLFCFLLRVFRVWKRMNGTSVVFLALAIMI